MNLISSIYGELKIQASAVLRGVKNSRECFCCLDYWLISNKLTDLVTSNDIIPAIRIDHDAQLRGPGSWKMNCFLLADEKYVNSVMELIPIWAAEGRKKQSDDRGVWDWIK